MVQEAVTPLRTKHRQFKQNLMGEAREGHAKVRYISPIVLPQVILESLGSHSLMSDYQLGQSLRTV